MARVLGDPSTCPHGNPMPGVKPSPTRTPGSLEPGQASVIERVPDQVEHEPGFLEYLESVGLRPGVSVTLVRHTHHALRVSVAAGPPAVRAECAHQGRVRA